MPFGSYKQLTVCIVNQFSILCEMDESSPRFCIPKTFDEEMACVINSIPKSTVYKNKWALQIFR